MKLNWGTSIAIFYGIFVLLFLSLVVASTKEDFHLVRKDYYAAELVHEDRMNQIRNLEASGSDIDIHVRPEKKLMEIQIPENIRPTQGKIWLYRPSDARLDKTWDVMKADNPNQILISLAGLQGGMWRCQLQWTDREGVEYWFEQQVVFP